MRQFYCAYQKRSTLWSELSWSHYRVLMRISDKTARDFYTEECAKSAWSVRQLERQIHTMYYQRLLASQDKASVAAEIQTTEPKPEYEKAIKDPYVMEFLQIKPDTHVYESDVEQALIDHLQQFLLELGRGFSFVSRQKRFTLDGQDFFIDLVFFAKKRLFPGAAGWFPGKILSSRNVARKKRWKSLWNLWKNAVAIILFPC